MRVVLATVGTRGDVQPMLALAQSLQRSGHEAVLACPESFGPWVRGLGIEHRELGEDLQAKIASHGKAATRAIGGMLQYFTQQMALQAPLLLDVAQGAHAVVGTAMAWMAPSVAEKLGIAALQLFPSTCVPSRLHPPPLLPFYGLPRWLNGALWWVNDLAQDRLMGRPVNLARAAIGLPPIAAFTRHLFLDTPGIFAADDVVMPPDPAWGDRYTYAGFLFLDDPTPLDPALDAWLSSGEPPIYVGFGSMAGEHPERVATLLQQAVRATGRRCLVSGWAAKLFEQTALPDGFFAAREAPHAKLLPRVAAVVHHGGSGTTAAALRAGVPQVILPMMLDQFHQRHHLVRAGLAPAAPSMAKVTSETFARAVQDALALPSGQLRLVADRLARSDAGRVIVERLERAASGLRG